MAISHVNTTTFASPGTTDTAITNSVPTGTVDGDLLLWAFSGGTSTPSAPTGWLAWAAAANGTTTHLTIFYRFALSEPASYTASGLASGSWTGILSAYRGVDQATPQDATPVTAGSATTPAITTVTANAYALAHGKAKSASGVITTAWTSSNGTISGQVTQTLGASTNDTSGATFLARPTAGAVTPNLAASGTLTLQCRITSALRPGTQLSTTASVSATATISATGEVSGTTTLAATDTLTATGATGTAATSQIAAVATPTASGTTSLTATLTETITLVAAGATSTATTATLTTTITLTAAGTVTSTATAARSEVATLSATGSVAYQAAASRTQTATISASGAVSVSASATLSLSAVLTGSVGATGQAALAALAALAATGRSHRPHTKADSDRLTTIATEDRVSVVSAENRTQAVPAEKRYMEVL